MRIFIKKNITEILQVIYESHKIIYNFINANNYKDAKLKLIECQRLSVQIGTMIEQSEGGDFITIAILGEYCKYVYQIFMNLSEEYSAKEIKKELDKRLYNLKKSINNDIKTKLEIVFLPYNASMWDSLESIWKAADDDPDCDAYVVPIPYYGRKKDFCLGKSYYEGLEFPDYVPITHFNEYNLAQRKPDIIYIHNPYDERNYVTSVDPRFYSSELKKYTHNLVYIPYFVLENQLLTDINHFITTPGVINADKVIVSSEKMRQLYIKTLLSIIGNNEKNKKMLENKILGLGSPKYDVILKSQEYEMSIPEEWQHIIYKPDGKRKKIIFFNTGVAALLEDGHQVIAKIAYVLQKFYERKDDIALLWRPHPLIQSTLESMRPHLLIEYQNIVKNYIQQGWGIYDESADDDRAINLCDAFYGDGSSLVSLVRSIGKLVVIQLPHFCGDLEKYQLSSECIYDDGSNIWLSPIDFCGIVKINKMTEMIEYISIVPDEEVLQTCAYVDISECCGKLYFCPFTANEIAVFNLQTNTIEKIPFINDETKNKFSASVTFGNKVYFIPFTYENIICLNSQTKEIKYINFKKDIPEKYMSKKAMGYFTSYLVYEDKIILPSSCADVIFIINTKNDTVTTIENLSEYNYSYSGIAYAQGYFYLSTTTGNIVKTSLFSDRKDVGIINISQIKGMEFTIYPTININDVIYFFDALDTVAYRLDTKNNNIDLVKMPDDIFEKGRNTTILSYNVTDSGIYCFSGNNNFYFCEFDMNFNIKTSRKIFLNYNEQSIIRDILHTKKHTNEIIYEESSLALNYLFENDCSLKSKPDMALKNIGKKIHETIKKNLI